jgi:hypothetical protein
VSGLGISTRRSSRELDEIWMMARKYLIALVALSCIPTARLQSMEKVACIIIRTDCQKILRAGLSMKGLSGKELNMG